nr:homocysteine S-methyltransferase family protein [Actinomyces respiraculi]
MAGPLGAFLADGSEYTGDYRVSDPLDPSVAARFDAVHRPRVEVLAAEGIGVFALETQPRLDEARALLAIVREAPETVAPALGVLNAVTSKPLVVYPNAGDVYDPVSKTWTAAAGRERFTALAGAWLDAGPGSSAAAAARRPPTRRRCAASSVPAHPPSAVATTCRSSNSASRTRARSSPSSGRPTSPRPRRTRTSAFRHLRRLSRSSSTSSATPT